MPFPINGQPNGLAMLAQSHNALVQKTSADVAMLSNAIRQVAAGVTAVEQALAQVAARQNALEQALRQLAAGGAFTGGAQAAPGSVIVNGQASHAQGVSQPFAGPPSTVPSAGEGTIEPIQNPEDAAIFFGGGE